MTLRTCARPDCSNTFEPTMKTHIYCSTECQLVMRKRRTWGRPLDGSPLMRECEVPECPNLFEVGEHNGHQRWCSKVCANVAHGRLRDGRALDGSRPVRTCERCGAEFVPTRDDQRFCTRRCKHRGVSARRTVRLAAVRQPPPPKSPIPCVQCGTLFTPAKRTSRFCSQPCEGRWTREHRTPEQRLHDLEAHAVNLVRRRMLALGSTAAFDRSVRLSALIVRDGSECHLCHEPCVDRASSGHGHPFYPSMDHLIPIVRGGAHTWENVKLAHVACNREKADDVCKACHGPITELNEDLCASCRAKGRKARVTYGVCRHCGYVEIASGWCDRCRARGAAIWIRTDLTKVKANALSRSLGFEPTGLTLPAPTAVDWIAWVA